MKISQAKRIHFTGIKGVGMAALAEALKAQGKKISGSDLKEVFPTDKVLKKQGIKIASGFAAKNLPKKCDLVIYTGAHGGWENNEVQEALRRKIPILNYAQALGEVVAQKKVIATAGVGGKSSTAAMLTVILESANFNPSFVVGVGNIKPLNTAGNWRKKSSVAVVETDEFVADPEHDLLPKFHYLHPYGVIITNVEHDHPDIYPNLDSVLISFEKFLSQVLKDGLILVNIDNQNVQQLVKRLGRPVVTYGFSPQADWRIVKNHTAHKKQLFTLAHKQITLADFTLSVPGKYNLLNATAAIVTAYHLGVNLPKIQVGIKAYQGSQRRFEFIGRAGGVDLYDDYAHHPIELKAMLKAARDWLPGKRIIAIFQSHTYSRTKALLAQFATSFEDASQVVINEIFSSAREKNNLGVSGKKLAEAIGAKHPDVTFCPDKDSTIAYLKKEVKKGEVVFTLGAGNNWLWHKDMLKALKRSHLSII